jgi:hypothetical protein
LDWLRGRGSRGDLHDSDEVGHEYTNGDDCEWWLGSPATGVCCDAGSFMPVLSSHMLVTSWDDDGMPGYLSGIAGSMPIARV